MGGVRTSIIGRPRPLPRHRRAHPPYTLNCDEPLILPPVRIVAVMTQEPSCPQCMLLLLFAPKPAGHLGKSLKGRRLRTVPIQ